MLSKFINFRIIKPSANLFRLNSICHLLHPWTPIVSSKTNFAECQPSKHRITYKLYVEPCLEDHDLKNMRLNRPMSPHLEVYGPTLPAMTSIAQRILGVALVFYILLLSGGTLFLANGIETYCTWMRSVTIPRPVEITLKFLISSLFLYHYFNGIRFCAWNLCKFLDMKSVYATGYAAAVAAVGAAAALSVST